MMVIDASVAVKWLLPEAGSAEAETLLKSGPGLMAPSIVRVEVAGAVLRRYRLKAMTEDRAELLCDHWNQLLNEGVLQLVPQDELYELAVKLSLKLKHPLPDCFYLAAGKQLGMPLLTADRALYDCGKGLAHKTSLLPGLDVN